MDKAQYDALRQFAQRILRDDMESNSEFWAERVLNLLGADFMLDLLDVANNPAAARIVRQARLKPSKLSAADLAEFMPEGSKYHMRKALLEFTGCIDATGGVETDDLGHTVPAVDTEWVGLGSAYIEASKALRAPA